jgi:hypothetical protein
VWVYFYTEFPFVRIRRGDYRVWKFGVAGARAFAVRERQVLLFGDYKRPDLGRLVDLEETSARVIEEVQVEDSTGGPVDRSFAYGRGDRLFFFKAFCLVTRNPDGTSPTREELVQALASAGWGEGAPLLVESAEDEKKRIEFETQPLPSYLQPPP